jgi:membrane-bound metal-dependent hydrolase YbcI (DUF457 family)
MRSNHIAIYRYGAGEAQPVGRASDRMPSRYTIAIRQEIAMTQVGHALMGTAIGILSLPSAKPLRWKIAYFTAFALLGNLPDLDLLYWGHQRYDISDSLFVTLLVGALITVLFAWLPSVRQHVGGRGVVLAGILAWLSHLLLDSFYNHGRGIAIFWPLSTAHVALPIPWFSAVPFIPPITPAHLLEYRAEFASYFPFVVAAYVLRRKLLFAKPIWEGS